MRYTAVIASRVTLAFVVFAALVTSACAQGSQDAPSGKATGGQKDTSERSNPVVREEPTVQRDERQILNGVISDKEKGPCPYSKGPCTRILVEEDPDADCRGGRGPLEPGCEKMYFDVTGKTEVLRKGRDPRKERASAAELHEGLRVSADYTGYDVAESYPSQTGARVVTILGSR
jgi:hypothetical protein